MASHSSDPTLVAGGTAAPAPTLSGVPGGYHLGELLGRGGEGEVREARQLALGRRVAVKFLREGRDSPADELRFRAEAAVTALLEHPNIVPVHDLDRDPQGRLRLVMKRVSGRTWREFMEQGGAAVDEHVALLLKVCDAVACAHGLGILHRDLKPDNVMIGAHGEVLVMDWGCAVHVGPQPPHPDIPLLRDQQGVSGTPAYLAPEQARADHAACGPWSDVHLLGGILYRILAGSPPRQGPDVRAIISAAALGEAIAEPAERAGRRVSLELSAIAMAALQPDPALRTRTVAEFAGALRLYLEHREVLQLVAEARREHDAARAGGAGADDAFRRALCAAEQAVRLWPALAVARRLEVAIGIDAARHAQGTGAFRQAARLAEAAATAAQAIGDDAAAAQAARLAATARAGDLAGGRREVVLRRLRWTAGIAIAVALAALAGGCWWTWRALAAAEAGLARAEREHAARVAGDRRAIPALLAQSRELARAKRFADALALVETAAGMVPDDAAVPLARAGWLIALGRRGDAVAALDASLALRADDQAAELRRLCLAASGAGDAALADLLSRMGLPEVAAELNLSVDRRAALAVAQLRRHWPALPAGAVKALTDGTLSLRLVASELAIESLEPLRGLPVSALDITGQDRLRDLAPLAGLPLTALVARTTGVRDFAPLRGLRLRRLQLGWYDSGFDLGLVRGMPLEVLEAPAARIVALDALAGMPLRELRLFGCDALADLSALHGMPLAIVTLDAPRTGSTALHDLSPLAGAPLSEVGLAWQRGVADLSPLRGAPIRRLIVLGTAVGDLGPALGPALRNLAIGAAPVSDLRPLLGLPLETLDCSPQSIAHGLDEILRQPGLRLVCGFRREDFPRWLELSRALADANPDYPWTATGVFRDGRLAEVRIVHPLRDLRPLAALTDLHVLQLGGNPSDLRPLAGLPLEELVFTPAKGALGLDALRSMPSLQRIGATPQTLRTAADYWRDAPFAR